MDALTREIVTDALDYLELTYRGWLKSRLANESERELARLKLSMAAEARRKLDLPEYKPEGE